MFYPNGLDKDESFLKHKVLELMFKTTNTDLGYALNDFIQDAFFWPFEMGNFQAMTRGLNDVRMILIMETLCHVSNISSLEECYF